MHEMFTKLCVINDKSLNNGERAETLCLFAVCECVCMSVVVVIPVLLFQYKVRQSKSQMRRIKVSNPS